MLRSPKDLKNIYSNEQMTDNPTSVFIASLFSFIFYSKTKFKHMLKTDEGYLAGLEWGDDSQRKNVL